MWSSGLCPRSDYLEYPLGAPEAGRTTGPGTKWPVSPEWADAYRRLHQGPGRDGEARQRPDHRATSGLPDVDVTVVRACEGPLVVKHPPFGSGMGEIQHLVMIVVSSPGDGFPCAHIYDFTNATWTPPPRRIPLARSYTPSG